MAKGKRGGFKDTHPIDLLVPVLKEVSERVGMPKDKVQDIVIGNVLLPGAGANYWRMASYLAGYPEGTSVEALNRQCSSGLQAAATIAGYIKAGYMEAGIAAGVESMSFGEMGGRMSVPDSVFGSEGAKNCMLPMGVTSENVAKKYGVTREKQDAFALSSFEKAIKAQKDGKFKSEIVPVTTTVKDKDGNAQTVTVKEDEGPRPTTLEGLQKLKPSFSASGCSTAGNSSQVSDGAAAVLLMRRSTARQLGLTPLATFRAFSVVGVAPEVMGIGPAFAIPAVLKQAGLEVADIDVFEINEAFASQAVFSVEALKIPIEKVNPLGGAIALGHPLGCTGARQIATIINELRRRQGRYGVTSMCIGSGMGAASVIEME